MAADYVRRILGQRGVEGRGFARVVFVNAAKNFVLGSGIRLTPCGGELSLLRKIWPNIARKPHALVWDEAGGSEMRHEWLEE